MERSSSEGQVGTGNPGVESSSSLLLLLVDSSMLPELNIPVWAGSAEPFDTSSSSEAVTTDGGGGEVDVTVVVDLPEVDREL